MTQATTAEGAAVNTGVYNGLMTQMKADGRPWLLTIKKKSKGSFYIAQYPVRWTAQSASHFLPSLTDLFIPTPFSASPGSILASQQLRAKTKSLTFPPLSIARYSFIQLSEQGRL